MTDAHRTQGTVCIVCGGKGTVNGPAGVDAYECPSCAGPFKDYLQTKTAASPLVQKLREIEDCYLDEIPSGFRETCGEAAKEIERLERARSSAIDRLKPLLGGLSDAYRAASPDSEVQLIIEKALGVRS